MRARVGACVSICSCVFVCACVCEPHAKRNRKLENSLIDKIPSRTVSYQDTLRFSNVLAKCIDVKWLGEYRYVKVSLSLSLSLSIYIYIYIYIHIYMRVCAFVCACVYMRLRASVRACARVCVCMSECVFLQRNNTNSANCDLYI